jgi:hypothetical protein
VKLAQAVGTIDNTPPSRGGTDYGRKQDRRRKTHDERQGQKEHATIRGLKRVKALKAGRMGEPGNSRIEQFWRSQSPHFSNKKL